MLKSNFYTQHPLLQQIVALAYTALLTVMLLQSSSHPYVGPPAPPGDPDPVREILLTSGHIVGFTLLVLVWWAALRPSPRALLIAIVIGLTLGTVTELLQSLVPDRSASLFDLVTNYVVTFGAAWVIRLRSR
jgi:VanZ family protein